MMKKLYIVEFLIDLYLISVELLFSVLKEHDEPVLKSLLDIRVTYSPPENMVSDEENKTIVELFEMQWFEIIWFEILISSHLMVVWFWIEIILQMIFFIKLLLNYSKCNDLKSLDLKSWFRVTLWLYVFELKSL